MQTHPEHIAHTLKPVPHFGRVSHLCWMTKFYKTAIAQGLDVKTHQPYMSAYSIILEK